MSGIMVHRLPGKTLPDALLDKIYASGPTVFGYVFLDGDAVSIDAYDEPKSKDSVKELLGAFPDEMLLIWDKFPEQFHLDDLQPNEIHDTMAIAAVGDFSNHKTEGSTRTDTYFMQENVLIPRIQQMFDMVDGDPDKLSEQLDKEIVRKEFRECGLKDTVIAVVCTRGNNKFKLYSRDGDVSTFEWGRINASFGYEEKEFPEKKEDMGSLMKEKRSRIIRKTTEETKKEEPTKIEEKKEELKNTTVLPKKAEFDFIVPNDWHKKSNSDKKTWQNVNLGTVLSGWRKWMSGQHIQMSRPAKEEQQQQQNPTVLQKTTVLHDLSKLKEASEFKKDTQPHVVKSADTLPAGSSVPSVKPSEIGIVSINERTAFEKKFNDLPEIKELLKVGAAPIMTVEQLKTLEAKTPSFYEVSGGWLVEYLEVLKNEQKLEIIKDHSNVALAALNTLLLQNRKHQKEIQQLKGEKEADKPKEKMPLVEKMRQRIYP